MKQEDSINVFINYLLVVLSSVVVIWVPFVIGSFNDTSKMDGIPLSLGSASVFGFLFGLIQSIPFVASYGIIFKYKSISKVSLTFWSLILNILIFLSLEFIRKIYAINWILELLLIFVASLIFYSFLIRFNRALFDPMIESLRNKN